MDSAGTFTSGRDESLWLNTHQQPQFTRLVANASADVCIIGAGIAGLTSAYLLACEGKSVIVLEDGLVGSGETGRTTAHLSNVIDDRYSEIERIHGETGARLAAESHTAAIARIERAVAEEHIACDFQRVAGYLILSEEHEAGFLTQEQEAAERAGLTVEFLERSPLSHVPRPCLRFPDQGQFHVLKYLTGLADAVMRRGGQIYTQTHATEIQRDEQCRIRTSLGSMVTAGSVVVATNTPVNDRVIMHTKQAPYRTYAVGMIIPHGSVTPALYWDTSDPYHYVRLQRLNETEDVLIVGGEDHKTGQADDTTKRHARLGDWARSWFPMVKREAYRWSGQVMESMDGLGFIGRHPGGEANTYIITGDSGMGMTHGTIAGLIVTDLICRRKNTWADLYDPGRMPVGAASEFVRENLNMAVQYTKWLRPGEVDAIDDIPPSHGAVIRKGLTKLAVYRDPNGEAHIRSAVCPHLGCIVSWNGEEHTWDCPCHGSRFDRLGKVLNGPANRDLSEPT